MVYHRPQLARPVAVAHRLIDAVILERKLVGELQEKGRSPHRHHNWLFGGGFTGTCITMYNSPGALAAVPPSFPFPLSLPLRTVRGAKMAERIKSL